jgi:hypothetical protein
MDRTLLQESNPDGLRTRAYNQLMQRDKRRFNILWFKYEDLKSSENCPPDVIADCRKVGIST